MVELVEAPRMVMAHLTRRQPEVPAAEGAAEAAAEPQERVEARGAARSVFMLGTAPCPSLRGTNSFSVAVEPAGMVVMEDSGHQEVKEAKGVRVSLTSRGSEAMAGMGAQAETEVVAVAAAVASAMAFLPRRSTAHRQTLA